VLLGIYIKYFTVYVCSESLPVYYDLKPGALNSLKKDAREKRDIYAAWRISAYYMHTKRNFAEGKKWEKIAREIEKEKQGRVLTNNAR
jgi:hypothetical protein